MTSETQVLICPDKFAGTLSAPEVAAALAAGWGGAAVVTRPLSDGGPGFIDALASALPRARVVPVPTVDPLGRAVAGSILLDGPTAYVESAQACGLHLLSPAERDPSRATSDGLGRLVAAAVAAGARTVVIGLGGSATNDAGAGMLAALGAAPLGVDGAPLPPGGAALTGCAALSGVPALAGATLVGACDVDSPLVGTLGAAAVYGPQKGASPADVAVLDAALAHFATVLATLPGSPPDLATVPGGGAAGGLGAAILALGGHLTSGIALVWRLAGLDSLLSTCELVITGEGSFDEQSLRGKVVAGVAAAARARGIDCVVVAGRVAVAPSAYTVAGVTEAYSLVDHFGSLDLALAHPAEGLRAIAARLRTASSRRRRDPGRD